MKVTLLGHATVIVEAGGTTLLMDPVFFDPFEEGAVVSCPRRTVCLEHLPSIDIVVVSHRHPDHFDLRSLDRLPRSCDVICPADPLIVHGLRGLGFEHIHPVYPMGEIVGEGFELYATRSEVATVREFGMVVADASGVFWNQVDSKVSTATIDAIQRRYGRIDLLFARYACQNFEFFESRAVSFPADEHRDNLEAVLRIAPRMVAPAAAGFRFCGDHAWLNAFLFPISRAQFLADLAQLAPDIVGCVSDPGDVFDIEGGEVMRRCAASPVALLEQDDTALLRWDPTSAIPELIDPGFDGRPIEELCKVIEQILTHDLATFVEEGLRAGDPVLASYREHAVRYAVGVVFSDGSTRWYGLAFSGDGVHALRGDPACASADAVHRIAASALVGWLERKKSFFFVRAWSRRHTRIHRSRRDGAAVTVEPVAIPDLLMHYVLHGAPDSAYAARRQVDVELAALGAASTRHDGTTDITSVDVVSAK